MKKSNRWKNNNFIHFVCLAITWPLWAVLLYPSLPPGVTEEPLITCQITERRANYFVIEVKNSEASSPSICSEGFVYINNRNMNPGNHDGTFIIIDREGSRLLCRLESIRPGIDGNRLKFAVLDVAAKTIQRQTQKENISKYKVLPFTVNNIRFVPVSGRNIPHGKYFVSAKPVAVHSITPLSISGINNLLFTIEKKSHSKFSANLIRLPQIHPLKLSHYIDFNDKQKLFLGIADGKLCLIVEENGVLQSTALSNTTLNKFKDNLYFYILLEKKERDGTEVAD